MTRTGRSPAVRPSTRLRGSPRGSAVGGAAPTTRRRRGLSDADQVQMVSDDGAAERRTLSVLVVDDEPAIRTLVRMLIDRSGIFEFAGEATDGAEGIELVKELQPDIVLLDLLMPGIDGRQALPTIIRESPRSMVVVLSALSG